MTEAVQPSVLEILERVQRADVLSAFDEIDRAGVHVKRKSRAFCTAYEGTHYPPKLVLSYATGFAYQGDPRLEHGLYPDDFYGGPQTNNLLRKLGFNVVDCACGAMSKAHESPSKAKLRPNSRLTIDGEAGFSDSIAAACLEKALDLLKSSGTLVEVLLTPGGFLEIDIPREDLHVGWHTPSNSLRSLRADIQQALSKTTKVLIRQRTREVVRFVTLGIDVNLSETNYAEVVATFDTQDGMISHLTGKSYPTINQEDSLLQVTDLSSHLQTLGGKRYLVLGCHDLNMFNGRSIANRNPEGLDPAPEIRAA